MAEEKSVVALFVDVRGFTRWSDAVEVFANLDDFISGFLALLAERFPDFEMKPLGDGAMLVRELSAEEQGQLETEPPTSILAAVLDAVRSMDVAFASHCADFSRRIGHYTRLYLGWGIIRGKVVRVDGDWAGSNINKASRLCGEARPFGVVIDRDDFQDLPTTDSDFVPQVRRLNGIADQVRVWVTPEIASQFVPREQIKEEPEVHVAGTCVRTVDGRIELLVARRSAGRRLYPNLLEGCGGQLRLSESFIGGVKRHFNLEMGIDVEVLENLHRFYEIREPDTPLIPGIRFLCRKIGNEEPRLANHSEVFWMTEEQFASTASSDFVGGLKQEILELVERFKAM